MRSRALVHVTGPAGAGKTAFIEQLLRAFDGFVLVARCVRDDSRRRFLESSPRAHPELRRYRKAGASGTALFTFPAHDMDLELVCTTRLMEDYSHALVLEGDCPSDLCDLRVHVVPALAPRRALLVRRTRDRAREEREQADAAERMLRQPDGVARFYREMFGDPAAEILLGSPYMLEAARASLLAGIEKVRSAPPPESTEHLAIAAGYEGIEHAQVVVVNVRGGDEQPGAERLLADLARIRKDPQVLQDVLGWRGKRIPITAVAADLTDARHPGTKKAVARIKRSMREG